MPKTEEIVEQDAPGTDLERRVYSSTELAQLSSLEALLLDPNVEIPEVLEEPEQISREIMQRLMNAGSLNELEVRKPLGWRRDLADVIVVVHGFQWRPSKYRAGGERADEGTGGPNVYFVVDGTRTDTGERGPITTGSANVLAQLVACAKLQAFPVQAKLIELPSTSRGFNPLALTFPENGEAA